MSIPSLSTDSLVLVAVINDPRDLEIARLLGWYRIPLRSAPKVVAVDFLAFYQTAAFGDDRWRIKFIAPVKGHELTTRLQLIQDEPDHPHAHQEYYKIQLGPLQTLPQPVLAEGWRRITFFYTTGEHLLNARAIRDLVVQSDERHLLWQALRERLTQSQQYQTEEPPEINLDPAILAALLGISEAPLDFVAPPSHLSMK
jgi:hypothetical protein